MRGRGLRAALSVLPGWPDDLDEVPRREAFKREHPGAEFTRVGDVVLGYVPLPRGGYTYGAASLGAVLDRLEAFFEDLDPDPE